MTLVRSRKDNANSPEDPTSHRARHGQPEVPAGSHGSSAILPTKPMESTPAPLYNLLKRSIISEIESGAWTPGLRIPSENEIAMLWGLSRQTANRALRELAERGYITRIQGVGSFVAETRYESGLELHSIADEVAARGHTHRADVLAHERVVPPDFVAWSLDLTPGVAAFHSKILHYESDTPIQLEDRFVSPAADPGYLDEDYTRTTPAKRLLSVLPDVAKVEEAIEAALAPPDVARMLQIEAGHPCLVVRRRTWANAMPVTLVTLTHPGQRYRLVVSFRPSESGL